MRALVFFLILANLLFFAYAQGYFGSPVSPDALRAQQQVHPERLRVLGPQPQASQGEADNGGALQLAAEAETPAPPVESAKADVLVAPTLAPAPAPEPPPVKEAVRVEPKAEARAPVAPACLLVTGLQPEEAERLTALAAAGNLDAQHRGEGGWWVFMPPQPDRKGADKKAGELQRLGVSEFFVVTEGPQKFAISLGVFSREETAQRRLQQLRAQGVRTAQVGPRATQSGRHLLEVKGEAGALASFRALLPAGTGKDCP